MLLILPAPGSFSVKWCRETCLSHPVIFLLTAPRLFYFCGFHFVILCFMFVFVIMVCLFLAALWSPVGKGLTSLSSLVCDVLLCFVTFTYGVLD